MRVSPHNRCPETESRFVVLRFDYCANFAVAGAGFGGKYVVTGVLGRATVYGNSSLTESHRFSIPEALCFYGKRGGWVVHANANRDDKAV